MTVPRPNASGHSHGHVLALRGRQRVARGGVDQSDVASHHHLEKQPNPEFRRGEKNKWGTDLVLCAHQHPTPTSLSHRFTCLRSISLLHASSFRADFTTAPGLCISHVTMDEDKMYAYYDAKLRKYLTGGYGDLVEGGEDEDHVEKSAANVLDCTILDKETGLAWAYTTSNHDVEEDEPTPWAVRRTPLRTRAHESASAARAVACDGTPHRLRHECSCMSWRVLAAVAACCGVWLCTRRVCSAQLTTWCGGGHRFLATMMARR